MAFIRKLFWFIRPLKKAKRGYSEEVLYSGWVDTLPPRIQPRRR